MGIIQSLIHEVIETAIIVALVLCVLIFIISMARILSSPTIVTIIIALFGSCDGLKNYSASHRHGWKEQALSVWSVGHLEAIYLGDLIINVRGPRCRGGCCGFDCYCDHEWYHNGKKYGPFDCISGKTYYWCSNKREGDGWTYCGENIVYQVQYKCACSLGHCSCKYISGEVGLTLKTGGYYQWWISGTCSGGVDLVKDVNGDLNPVFKAIKRFKGTCQQPIYTQHDHLRESLISTVMHANVSIKTKWHNISDSLIRNYNISLDGNKRKRSVVFNDLTPRRLFNPRTDLEDQLYKAGKACDPKQFRLPFTYNEVCDVSELLASYIDLSEQRWKQVEDQINHIQSQFRVTADGIHALERALALVADQLNATLCVGDYHAFIIKNVTNYNGFLKGSFDHPINCTIWDVEKLYNTITNFSIDFSGDERIQKKLHDIVNQHSGTTTFIVCLSLGTLGVVLLPIRLWLATQYHVHYLIEGVYTCTAHRGLPTCKCGEHKRGKLVKCSHPK